MMKPINLRHINQYASTCHWGVIRKGIGEPCDKKAVAAAVDTDHEDPAFPVCAYHANKANANDHELVPLNQIIRFWSPPRD